MSVATKSLSATGRRKNATARVRMTEGSGTITINGRPFDVHPSERAVASTRPSPHPTCANARN